MSSDTKKYLLSALVVFAFVAYVIHSQSEGNSTVVITAPQNMMGPSGVSPMMSRTIVYKDGSYTGTVADAFYGNVQVKATISGGKITDIVFLDYPHDRQTSREINSQAMPILKQEAIQIQTANVDIVSGATATSQAFVESLQSALNQAK